MKNTINLRMAFFGLPAYNVIDEPQRDTEPTRRISSQAALHTARRPRLVWSKGQFAKTTYKPQQVISFI